MPPKKYPKSIRKKNALRTVARTYADAAQQQPKEYWNDVCNIDWGNQDKYEVLQQLGKGKYGEVFEGVNIEANQRCVVKIMRPVKEQRLKREIKILRLVSGGPNIVTLHEVVRDPDTKTPCFIFEFVDTMTLKELQAVVTDMDVRSYMYQVRLWANNSTMQSPCSHSLIAAAAVAAAATAAAAAVVGWTR
jgi:casein kinase II subunit alpha